VEIHTEKGETEVSESTYRIGERETVGTVNCWGLQLGPGGCVLIGCYAHA
jgi:hypothetical protein